MASTENKSIAREAAAAFGGGDRRVNRYWDDDHRSWVDILACPDSPWPGTTSYATLGLSDTPLVQDGRELPIRAELVGVCASRFDTFANYLATAAFYVINSGALVAPGVILPGVLSMYDSTRPMKHLLFLPPFLWERGPSTLELPAKKVAWLLAIPISDEEMQLAVEQGSLRLEDELEKAQVDVADLDRRSVV